MKISLILDKIDSTQLELKRQLEKQLTLEAGSFVQAHVQSSGRGRHEREWVSPTGNLYFSFILDAPEKDLTWVPLHVALAVDQAVATLGVGADQYFVKWPNDLLSKAGEKLAGILCEKISNKIVVGVGVNMSHAPAGLDRKTTCIETLLRRALPRGSIERLRNLILENATQGIFGSRVRDGYQNRLIFKKDQKISWKNVDQNDLHLGTYLGLGEYGELLVLEQGKTKSLFSEEVHLVQVN